jgi:transcriptional regulator with XRE-family HTH domain
MASFQITLSPTKRAAGRFVYGVRRALQRAFAEEQTKRGLTQTAIANTIGVHRSVISRELRGVKDITLSRVAELASAMGRKAVLTFPEITLAQDANASLPHDQQITATWSHSQAPDVVKQPLPSFTVSPTTIRLDRDKLILLAS